MREKCKVTRGSLEKDEIRSDLVTTEDCKRINDAVQAEHPSNFENFYSAAVVPHSFSMPHPSNFCHETDISSPYSSVLESTISYLPLMNLL